MKIKSLLAKPFAIYIHKQIKKGMATAVADQEQLMTSLIKTAAKTQFGKDHFFSEIKTHEDFVKNIPIRDYEAFKPYIEKIKEGKRNILWKGDWSSDVCSSDLYNKAFLAVSIWLLTDSFVIGIYFAPLVVPLVFAK